MELKPPDQLTNIKANGSAPNPGASTPGAWCYRWFWGKTENGTDQLVIEFDTSFWGAQGNLVVASGPEPEPSTIPTQSRDLGAYVSPRAGIGPAAGKVARQAEPVIKRQMDVFNIMKLIQRIADRESGKPVAFY